MREMKPDSQNKKRTEVNRQLKNPFETEKKQQFGDYEQEIRNLPERKKDFWKDDENMEPTEEERAYRTRREIRERRFKARKRKQRQKRMALMLLLAAVFLSSGYMAYKKSGKDAQFQMPSAGSFLKTAAMHLTGRGVEEDAESTEASGTAEEEKEDTQKNKSEKEDGKDKSKEDKKLREEELIAQADFYAAQYDYDKAIKLLKEDKRYEKSEMFKEAVSKYEETKASCISWPVEEVTHVFYHSLIVDTDRAFDGDYKDAGYNQVMTTIGEFNKITQSMYDKGYVMVSLKDMAYVSEDGTMKPGEILLPPGKIPFVLSQDDVSYYHCMDGDGFASKLIVDDEGNIRNEYIEKDGSTSVGDYDMVPLIDRFVEKHPDFSYRGAKGIIALTGYNGILGYRTDISYETRPDDLDDDKVAWLNAHPDFNLEKEREAAKKVADAMREEGWEFASHTWGHKNMSEVSLERLQTDTKNFKENVDPLIGGTDVIIFAFGADIPGETEGRYSGELYEYLKSQGYKYYCNVDSSKYYVQLTDEYLRQGRRNLDGYRMYYNPDLLSDLFDPAAVFESSRPVPVPPMG